MSASRRIRATARDNNGDVAPSSLNVGLIGLGTVGAQVADRLLRHGPQLARRAGVELCLQRVLVRDLSKQRAVEASSNLLPPAPPPIPATPPTPLLTHAPPTPQPAR